MKRMIAVRKTLRSEATNASSQMMRNKKLKRRRRMSAVLPELSVERKNERVKWKGMMKWKNSKHK